MKHIMQLPLAAMLTILLACGGQSSATERQLCHVLLFKWKPDVTDAEILVLDDLWKELSSKVDGFNDYELFRLHSGEYNHVVNLRFSSQAAYEAYLNHEKHLRIAELGKGMVERFFTYSYWN